MALDTDSNVWITGFRSPGILTRVTPEGETLSPVRTPEGSTTQIRFGGADLKDYFINIVPADGGDSLKKGEPLKSPSILYRGKVSPRFPRNKTATALPVAECSRSRMSRQLSNSRKYFQTTSMTAACPAVVPKAASRPTNKATLVAIMASAAGGRGD